MISFGVIADVQYADIDDSINRQYRRSIVKLLEACGAFTEKKVDFVLQLGDLIDRNWESMTAVQELLEHTGLPFRHVLGNHDFLVQDEKKPDIYTVLNRPKPGYDTFEIKDTEDPQNHWKFLLLNGNEISIYAAENDAERDLAQQEREKHPTGSSENEARLPQTYNGSLSEKQLRWLDDELTDADRKGINTLVCSHFPLYAVSGSVKKTNNSLLDNVGLYFASMGISTWNGQEVLDILDQHSSVRAYFAGHLHEGGYGLRNGVHHVTFRGTVEMSPNAYAFVRLQKDKIIIEGAGKQQSYTLDFT
ncbi:MAG: metallophosphoesterase [Thermoguttaceae bacterium]|nr:metallophosphoesterase [Thermoguttaceae bacterium]